MARTLRSILPLALAALALGAGSTARSQPLPDPGVVSNASRNRWKLKLAADDKSQVGSIGIANPMDKKNKKLTLELKTKLNEFVLPGGASFSLYFLDAPEKGSLSPKDRCFRRKFILMDEQGRKLLLEAYRKESPLSNVFLTILSPVAGPNRLDLLDKIIINDGAPGCITIMVPDLPGYVPQK